MHARLISNCTTLRSIFSWDGSNCVHLDFFLSRTDNLWSPMLAASSRRSSHHVSICWQLLVATGHDNSIRRWENLTEHACVLPMSKTKVKKMSYCDVHKCIGLVSHTFICKVGLLHCMLWWSLLIPHLQCTWKINLILFQKRCCLWWVMQRTRQGTSSQTGIQFLGQNIDWLSVIYLVI